MRVGVTGGDGFLGWHLRARLLAHDVETMSAGRSVFAADELLDEFVASSNCIVHVAGVNRARTESELRDGNLSVAYALVESMRRTGSNVPVLYTNSIHATNGGVYGDAKRAVSELLRSHQAGHGGEYLDLILPHLFGEFGKPFYNSVASTFAHQLADGTQPEVNADGQLELLHAQQVAARILEFVRSPTSGSEVLSGRPTNVGELWELMRSLYDRYVNDFTVPSFRDQFELRVFNTLRSQLYANGHYPVALTAHGDSRGVFMELARADCLGQTSLSTSVPGITRGDHFHFDKVERFVVASGRATIRLRQVLTDDLRVFEVSGEDPVFIDMPPLTTHNITNVGDSELTTIFWAADHFDPAVPDTWPDPVEAL